MLSIEVKINGELVDTLSGAQLINTLDETLDSGYLILTTTTIAEPFKPMLPVEIYWLNEDDIIQKAENYIIINDSVTVFSTYNPVRYQHKIGIAQNTRTLSKYVCRNSVFTPPAEKLIKGYMAKSILYKVKAFAAAGGEGPGVHINGEESSAWNEDFEIEPDSIITNPKLKVDIFKYGINHAGAHSIISPILKPHTLIYSSTIKIYKYSGSGNIWNLKKSIYNETLSLPYNVNLDDLIPLFNNGGVFGIQMEIDFPTDSSYYDPSIIAEEFVEYNQDITMDTEDKEDFNVTFVVNIHFTANYSGDSVWSVIDQLRNQQLQWVNIPHQPYNESSRITMKDALWTMPTGEVATLFKNTLSPQFTFTQMTYYEALAEIYKVFDGIMTLDGSKKLGIEYYNERLDTPKIDTLTKTGVEQTIQEDRYNNGMVANYQRARNYDEYPKNGYCVTSSTILGVPQQSSWEMRTGLPIEAIKYLNVFITGKIMLPSYTRTGTTLVYTETNFNMPLDISTFIVEESVYKTFSTMITDEHPDAMSQRNHLYYRKGIRGIPCGEYYKTRFNHEKSTFKQTLESAIYRWLGFTGNGTLTLVGSDEYVYDIDFYQHSVLVDMTVPDNVRFRVGYTALTNGRLKIEGYEDKFRGEMLGNQNSGGVDLNKLGLNMLGTMNKMGEPTFSVTLPIAKNYDETIQKGTIYTDENNQKWIANICNFTFYKGYVREQIEFVKNFNMLAQRVALDQDKRFTEISRDIVVMGEDNLIEYMYYTSDMWEIDDAEYEYKKIHLFDDTLEAMFKCACGYPDTDWYGNSLDYAIVNHTFLPISRYLSANNICFEMQYNDPLSAGNGTAYNDYYEGLFVVPKIYTDSRLGKMKDVNIVFKHNTQQSEFDSTFPRIAETKQNQDTTVGNIILYNYYKRPNEIFGLNYQIQFLNLSFALGKKQSTFLGPAFFENRGLLFDPGEHRTNMKIWNIYYSETHVYTEWDTHGVGQLKEQHEIEVSYVTVPKYYSLTVQCRSGNYHEVGTSWAVCDGEGRILFAHNNVEGENLGDNWRKLEVRFYPSVYRIDIA